MRHDATGWRTLRAPRQLPRGQQGRGLVELHEPDPTRIPGGCRFHPRCPALADGTAAAEGVDEACLSGPLDIVPPDPGGHHVACHLAAVRNATGSAARSIR